MCICLTSSRVGCVRAKVSKDVNGGKGEFISPKWSLPQLDAESLKTESALWTSQFSAIAGRDGVGDPERMEEPELESWRKVCSRSWNPKCWPGFVVGGLMPMCSGLETVLLLFRGLTGSYPHLRPLSRQRSHWGRSSLHFFFFSLLPSNQYRAGSATRETNMYQCTQPGKNSQALISLVAADVGVFPHNKAQAGLPARERRLGDFAGTGLWYSNIMDGEQSNIKLRY